MAVPYPRSSWRYRLHEIVFEADTPAGKIFDVVLLAAIVASVVVVMLDSVAEISRVYGTQLVVLEWFFTLLFTVEYVARLASVGRPSHYALSFFGVVDLLAIIPTYLSLVLAGTQSLVVIRILRLLRIFRVFKLRHYLTEAEVLEAALKGSRAKITVFLSGIISIAVVIGAMMYLIEGRAGEFTSIQRGVYWAIVTMTTVGYGDIAPPDHRRADRRKLLDDSRLRDYRRADRYRVCAARAASPSSGGLHASVSGLRGRGSRRRRRVLQVLWGQFGTCFMSPHQDPSLRSSV